MRITLRRIALPLDGFDALAAEASAEGYAFIDRLEREWDDASNRFSDLGEQLLGCFDGFALVAVGGLNRDPFTPAPRVGRVRHVYVRPGWRHRGVGAALVRAIIEAARGSFDTLRLRTDAPAARRFYERLGFERFDEVDATHRRELGAPGP